MILICHEFCRDRREEPYEEDSNGKKREEEDNCIGNINTGRCGRNGVVGLVGVEMRVSM